MNSSGLPPLSGCAAATFSRYALLQYSFVGRVVVGSSVCKQCRPTANAPDLPAASTWLESKVLQISFCKVHILLRKCGCRALLALLVAAVFCLQQTGFAFRFKLGTTATCFSSEQQTAPDWQP